MPKWRPLGEVSILWGLLPPLSLPFPQPSEPQPTPVATGEPLGPTGGPVPAPMEFTTLGWLPGAQNLVCALQEWTLSPPVPWSSSPVLSPTDLQGQMLWGSLLAGLDLHAGERDVGLSTPSCEGTSVI